MSLNEIRETLQGTVTISDEGYGILNKRINLKEGYRHTIEAIDWFNDMGVMWTLNAPEGEGVGPTGYQFYLSPYPIQVTDEDWEAVTIYSSIVDLWREMIQSSSRHLDITSEVRTISPHQHPTKPSSLISRLQVFHPSIGTVTISTCHALFSI